MRNQLKNEEQVESSKEWEGAGSQVQSTAWLQHAFVPPGHISSGVCPRSLQIGYAGHSLPIQMPMEFFDEP